MDRPPPIPSRQDAADRLERIQYPTNRRLARMRALSRLLDTAIRLPGGFRIGLDPIIGLVPGIGDVIASALSAWLLYDAARLGIAKRVLARMVANIAFETIVGAVPVLGDLIDAAWKANVRNMRLVEANYTPTLKQRSFGKLLLVTAAVLLVGTITTFLAIQWVLEKGLIEPLRNLFQSFAM